MWPNAEKHLQLEIIRGPHLVNQNYENDRFRCLPQKHLVVLSGCNSWVSKFLVGKRNRPFTAQFPQSFGTWNDHQFSFTRRFPSCATPSLPFHCPNVQRLGPWGSLRPGTACWFGEAFSWGWDKPVFQHFLNCSCVQSDQNLWMYISKIRMHIPAVWVLTTWSGSRAVDFWGHKHSCLYKTYKPTVGTAAKIDLCWCSDHPCQTHRHKHMHVYRISAFSFRIAWKICACLQHAKGPSAFTQNSESLKTWCLNHEIVCMTVGLT